MRSLALWALVGCGWPVGAVQGPVFADPPAPTTPSTPVPEPTVVPEPEPEPEPEPTAPGERLFDPTGEPAVSIFVDADALDSLDRNPTAWVPAEITVEGFLPVADARVRLKGNGSFQNVYDKPSLRIDLDPHGVGITVDGMKRFVLNNMSLDPSGLREHAAYHAYRSFGVPAPRSIHAGLTFRERDYGLYMLVEETDDDMLARWYDDGDGALYEVFDVDLTPTGVLLLDHDDGPDERQLLIDLAAVLADPNSRFSRDVTPYVDMEQMVDYLGMSAVIAQYDAYPYSLPGDDVYLYIDPADHRIDVLPHGADETFRDPNRPVDYVYGLLVVRCMEDQVCEEAFDAAVWRALDAVEGMGLRDRIDQWAEEMPVFRRRTNTDLDRVDVVVDQDQIRNFLDGRAEGLSRMPGLEGP